MIFGPSKPESEKELKDNNLDVSVFPLSIPSIASPGAMMAAVRLTDKNRFNISEQAVTVTAIIIVLIITLVLLLLAEKILNLISEAGAVIISRIMGLILASLAVDGVLTGINNYFGIGI